MAVQGPSGPAAAEAASGLWLTQLEAGLQRPAGLPCVAAPGLGAGLFGGWAGPTGDLTVPEQVSQAWNSQVDSEDWVAFTGHHRMAPPPSLAVPPQSLAAPSPSPSPRAAVLPPLPLMSPGGERIKPLAAALLASAGSGSIIAAAAGSGPGSGSRAGIAGTFADLWMEPELATMAGAEEEGEAVSEAGPDGEARRGRRRGAGAGGVLAELETEAAAVAAGRRDKGAPAASAAAGGDALTEGDGRFAAVLAAASGAGGAGDLDTFSRRDQVRRVLTRRLWRA